MSHETGPGMDGDFARRMRSGLAAMAPREVARTRRIRGRVAGGALGAMALAVVTVLGVQVVGAGGQGGVEAVPTPTPTPTSSIEPTPEPSVEPTQEPDPEPTPPPGFEGVAAGQPVVVGTRDTTYGGGDTGAAGDGEPVVQHDLYVLCRSVGVVELPGRTVNCSQLQQDTVIVLLDVTTPAAVGVPQATWSDDFTGVVHVMPAGEAPPGTGVGGVAAVWVPCGLGVSAVGESAFTCTWTQGVLAATEEAAWGIPYGADELVPPITREVGTGDGQVLVFELDPQP